MPSILLAPLLLLVAALLAGCVTYTPPGQPTPIFVVAPASIAPTTTPNPPNIAPAASPTTISAPATPTPVHPTATTVPPSPTTAPVTPTAHPIAAPSDTTTRPTLGAPAVAFVARLGQPNDHSDAMTLHWQRCAGNNVDGFIITFIEGHAYLITRQNCLPAAPAEKELVVEATTFMPTDGKTVNGFVTQNSEKAVEEISASLAGQLPAVSFHDCNGDPVKPGTFSLVVTADGGWVLALGTCP